MNSSGFGWEHLVIWLTNLAQIALLLAIIWPWVWRKWRFSLWSMLVLMTGIAVALGLVMWAVKR